MSIDTFFYVIGGVLVAAALIIAFLGIRKEDFPRTKGQMRLIAGVVAVLVVATCVGAVGVAREHALHDEDEHAAEVAEGEEEETLEEEAPEAEAPQPQDPDADGEQLFADLGCGGCHTLAAVDAATGETGPNLDQSLAQPDADEEFIRISIVDPDADVAEGFQPGIMPPYGNLSSDELDALVSFLQDATQN
jgi:mono/diheme cytochrome c family protein